MWGWRLWNPWEPREGLPGHWTLGWQGHWTQVTMCIRKCHTIWCHRGVTLGLSHQCSMVFRRCPKFVFWRCPKFEGVQSLVHWVVESVSSRAVQGQSKLASPGPTSHQRVDRAWRSEFECLKIFEWRRCNVRRMLTKAFQFDFKMLMPCLQFSFKLWSISLPILVFSVGQSGNNASNWCTFFQSRMGLSAVPLTQIF